MKFSFEIDKHINASASNVIANYLDLQHLPSHSGLEKCRVLSETETVACFVLSSRIGPLMIRNVHFFQYLPPYQVLQVIKSPLGPMKVLATTRETCSDPDNTQSIVNVQVELDMPRWVYPFRNLIRVLLSRLNRVVLDEDCYILERRQKLLGDYVGDYFQEEHKMLFKETFRQHFSGDRKTEQSPT